MAESEAVTILRVYIALFSLFKMFLPIKLVWINAICYLYLLQ